MSNLSDVSPLGQEAQRIAEEMCGVFNDAALAKLYHLVLSALQQAQARHEQELDAERAAFQKQIALWQHSKAETDQAQAGPEIETELETEIRALLDNKRFGPATFANHAAGLLQRVLKQRAAPRERIESLRPWWCCVADYPSHEPTCPNAGGRVVDEGRLRRSAVSRMLWPDLGGLSREHECERGEASERICAGCLDDYKRIAAASFQTGLSVSDLGGLIARLEKWLSEDPYYDSDCECAQCTAVKLIREALSVLRAIQQEREKS